MIFYFSATGNSRYVADRIAAATGDKTVSIPDCCKNDHFSFDETDKTVGIVCPTYSWGLPSIVQEFLEKLTLHSQPSYLWFTATYGTTPGQTGRFAEDILKRSGLTISAKLSVRMPDTWTPLFDLSSKENVQRINAAAEPQIDRIIQLIQSRTSGDFMQRKMPLWLAKSVYAIEYPSMRQTRHFHVEDSCIGCGLCARNCPASAIQIQNKKPVWVKEQCVMCLSCLHHCPKFAIQYGSRTQKHGQYSHFKLS